VSIRLASGLAAAAIALFAPLSVSAQDTPEPEGSVFDGDYITLGVGGAYLPDYEGSDDYDFSFAPVVQGSLGGIRISPRPRGVALDFIPEAENAKIGFQLGPVARIRRNRTGNLKDNVVESLGELDTAIEVGVDAGISINRLLNPFDSLTLSTDVRWDVAGAHDGRLISPAISYFTPVSQGAAVALSLSAEHGDDDFMQYNFGVTSAGALASGLPVFTADEGFNSYSIGALGAIDLDGNLLNGGLSVVLIGAYSRMLNDAKRSPVTAIRGDADQFLGGIGLSYTF